MHATVATLHLLFHNERSEQFSLTKKKTGKWDRERGKEYFNAFQLIAETEKLSRSKRINGMAYNDKHRKRVKFVLLTCSWLTHLNGHFKVLSFLDSFTGSTHAYTQTHTERIWMCEPVCVCVFESERVSEWERQRNSHDTHTSIRFACSH